MGYAAEQELKLYKSCKEKKMKEAEQQQQLAAGRSTAVRRVRSVEDRQRIAQKNIDLLNRRLQVAQAAVRPRLLPMPQDQDFSARQNCKRLPCVQKAFAAGDDDAELAVVHASLMARTKAVNRRPASAGPC